MQIASLPKIALVSILASFAFQANACIYWDPHRAIDDPSVRTTPSAKARKTAQQTATMLESITTIRQPGNQH